VLQHPGLPLRIIVKIERPPGVSARRHREWMRAAFHAQGLHWQTQILPTRFRANASYPRKKRTEKYLRQKANAAAKGKIRDASIDNVYSGFLRDKLTAPAVIRAFPTRVTIKMVGPRYITMRVYQSNQPDKAKELLWVSPSEIQKLRKVLLAEYERQRAAAAPATETHTA
jgi:hypothetical protein